MAFPDRTTRTLTIAGVAVLVALGVRYALQSRWELLGIDIVISLLGLAIFLWAGPKLDQDNWSYGAFLLMLALHSAYLYDLSPLGIRWDHYMHFVGGVSIALIADRMFMSEHWSMRRRIVMLLLLTLGIGAVHEVVEFFGYAFLGRGEGFLLFGSGDEGEWRNAILDLCYDFLGAAAVSIAIMFRKKK